MDKATAERIEWALQYAEDRSQSSISGHVASNILENEVRRLRALTTPPANPQGEAGVRGSLTTACSRLSGETVRVPPEADHLPDPTKVINILHGKLLEAAKAVYDDSTVHSVTDYAIKRNCVMSQVPSKLIRALGREIEAIEAIENETQGKDRA